MSRVASCLVISLAVTLGCQEPAPEPERRAAASVPTSAATISIEPVSGTILGKPFALASARYSVDRRPGYEKLEIILLSSRLERPCEELGPNRDAAVWLRRRGVGEPKAGSWRFSPHDTGPWEAHYERFEDGNWSGNGDANVVLELSEPTVDLELTGDVYACFADRSASCVSGRFVATFCPIRIDAPVRGMDSMERPPARSGRAAANTD